MTPLSVPRACRERASIRDEGRPERPFFSASSAGCKPGRGRYLLDGSLGQHLDNGTALDLDLDTVGDFDVQEAVAEL